MRKRRRALAYAPFSRMLEPMSETILPTPPEHTFGTSKSVPPAPHPTSDAVLHPARIHDHNAVMNSIAILKSHFGAMEQHAKTGAPLATMPGVPNPGQINAQVVAMHALDERSCHWVEGEHAGDWNLICK
jgi:hypothetical protein